MPREKSVDRLGQLEPAAADRAGDGLHRPDNGIQGRKFAVGVQRQVFHGWPCACCSVRRPGPPGPRARVTTTTRSGNVVSIRTSAPCFYQYSKLKGASLLFKYRGGVGGANPIPQDGVAVLVEGRQNFPGQVRPCIPVFRYEAAGLSASSSTTSLSANLRPSRYWERLTRGNPQVCRQPALTGLCIYRPGQGVFVVWIGLFVPPPKMPVLPYFC